MCGSGCDDWSGGVVEEVSGDHYSCRSLCQCHEVEETTFDFPLLFTGTNLCCCKAITSMCHRAHPYEEVAYEVYKMENV